MADNLSPPGTPCHGLSDHAAVRLHGPDAVAFAQAQFANDVAVLEDGHWHWNCWLTPKGRVIAVFALARIDGQDLLAILPDAPAAGVAQALSRFVFRRKVRIEACTTLRVGGRLAAPVQARGAHLARIDGGWELDAGSAAAPRTWVVTENASGPEADMPARWKALDLAYGLPRLDEPAREQWTPQQLSLDRLQAFSVKKGCYPGQEIVARTHFLGKAKRGLALFATGGVLEVGASLLDGPSQAGTIVSSAPGLALAVVSLDAPPAQPHVGDVLLEPRPLLDGLAR